MPIADNNPERRNLMVTAFAFNLYFLGGGSVDSSSLKIQAINISFENLYVIAISAWILLFWFYWRYSQKHKNEFLSAIRDEVKTETTNPVLIAYLKQQTNKPYRDENGFTVKQIIPNKGKWSAQIALIEGGKRDDNNRWVEFKRIDSKTYNINKVWWGLVKLSLISAASYKKPSFGSWFVPPALFYTACLLGVIELIKC